MHPDLVAIRRRYDRVVSHAHAADAVVRPWHEANNPHGLAAHYDLDTREVQVRVVIREPYPAIEVALIFSDMLNGLRACLDNLWWSAMCSFGQDNPNGQFPIAEHEKQWASACEKRQSSDWESGFEATVAAMQPFNTGARWSENHFLNHPLFRLQKLSNKDKHKVLRVPAPSPATGFHIWHPGGFAEPEIEPILAEDGIFLRKTVEPGIDFRVEDLKFPREHLVQPCIQIPGFNYFTGFAALGGQLMDAVNDAINDLSPFIHGERALDYDPLDRTWDDLARTTVDIYGDQPPEPNQQ